ATHDGAAVRRRAPLSVFDTRSTRGSLPRRSRRRARWRQPARRVRRGVSVLDSQNAPVARGAGDERRRARRAQRRPSRPARMTAWTSTYRVQLGAQFTLRDLRNTIPYFDDLGISHVYCSPLLAA